MARAKLPFTKFDTIESLFWYALAVSSPWYSIYEYRRDLQFTSKRFALACKARAVVLFDRTINGEISDEHAAKLIERSNAVDIG